MPLTKFDGLELPASADFHVHLRDGNMMKAVVPTIRQGGVNTVYVSIVLSEIRLHRSAHVAIQVMPNLVPPLTSASDAMAYKQRLREEDPNTNYLMTLYLHEKITPAVVKGAKAQGIVGIKSYPAGVTTNSSSGVLDYEVFYPVFRAMEQCGMVLNLHGECPSDHGKNITILNAESSFLPTLKSLHAEFPKVSHCDVDALKQGGLTSISIAQNRLGALHDP